MSLLFIDSRTVSKSKHFVNKVGLLIVMVREESQNDTKMDKVRHLFDFYLNHLSELVRTYDGKYIVLSSNEVKYAAATHEEAMEWAMKNLKLGEFIVQKCSTDKGAYTQTFHTRAIFA